MFGGSNTSIESASLNWALLRHFIVGQERRFRDTFVRCEKVSEWPNSLSNVSLVEEGPSINCGLIGRSEGCASVPVDCVGGCTSGTEVADKCCTMFINSGGCICRNGWRNAAADKVAAAAMA